MQEMLRKKKKNVLNIDFYIGRYGTNYVLFTQLKTVKKVADSKIVEDPNEPKWTLVNLSELKQTKIK